MQWPPSGSSPALVPERDACVLSKKFPAEGVRLLRGRFRIGDHVGGSKTGGEGEAIAIPDKQTNRTSEPDMTPDPGRRDRGTLNLAGSTRRRRVLNGRKDPAAVVSAVGDWPSTVFRTSKPRTAKDDRYGARSAALPAPREAT